MAITKIHPIKATVNKAIEYICNPDKTDESIYISAFACAAETAAYDFKYTIDHANDFNSIEKEEKENKAFHLIQAFEPGEVSPDEAHAIGKELADRLLEGKYSYVLTTHVDKNHVHNHIIFCAVDNIEHRHCHHEKSYWRIRNHSDRLCREHNLSVIDPGTRRGMKYKEWYERKNNNSWKVQLKKDINQSIKAASIYDDFLALMKAKGYELKNTSFDENDGKYIAFRPLGQKYFIRGREKSLGANFTKEKIKERIETKRQLTHAYIVSGKKTRRLIDTSIDPKYAENAGLQKWATKENLKIASKSYSQMTEKNIHTFPQLDERINTLQEQSKSANTSIVSLEHRIREIAEAIKYVEQYQINKPFNERYEKAKDQDRFLRRYESQIILFSGADRMLKRKGVSPSKNQLEDLKADYRELLNQKQCLSGICKSAQSEIKELELMKQNLKQYMDISPADKSLNPKQDISQNL